MGFFSSLLNSAGVAKIEELNTEYGKLLTEGEIIEVGYRVIRDVFIFTNKRLILVDKQGVSGKKVEYKTVAYKSISRFSVESAGEFDLDAELKIWVASETMPSIDKKFSNTVNIYDVQKILAKYVL
jgi:hypothetical protein